ncbi:hypothetical protein HanLR1_Chr02g0050551 [Helianthus annuus]|nr:hypothetical protein HanLR1_Chr02g0050551 [Helianthus annuus]
MRVMGCFFLSCERYDSRHGCGRLFGRSFNVGRSWSHRNLRRQWEGRAAAD